MDKACVSILWGRMKTWKISIQIRTGSLRNTDPEIFRYLLRSILFSLCSTSIFTMPCNSCRHNVSGWINVLKLTTLCNVCSWLTAVTLRNYLYDLTEPMQKTSSWESNSYWADQRIFPPFMKPECSLPCKHKLTSSPCPVPVPVRSAAPNPWV